MNVFWVAAAFFLAGTMALLLPGLWAGATAPQEGAAAGARPARRTALVLGLLIPVGTLGLYRLLGAPELAAPRAVPAQQAAPSRTDDAQAQQIQQRVAALADRLRANPGDAQGWLMLGRSYAVLARYRDAVAAYRRAADLLPPQASLLADLADLTAMAQGKRFAGEPARLVQQALDLDPRHVKALALAGSVTFEARDYAAARGYWERALAELPADAPMGRSLRGSIAEASRLERAAAAAGLPVAPAAVTATAPSSPPTTRVMPTGTAPR
jgi:cytochrome c-type biogenesis protein CcmH